MWDRTFVLPKLFVLHSTDDVPGDLSSQVDLFCHCAKSASEDLSVDPEIVI